jgi:transcriptional regulator with XRE-family HTH domain
MTAEQDLGPVAAESVLAFFSEELRRHRARRGWSQAQTAKAALSTQSMISKVEAAKLVPSEILAAGLDKAFETDGIFSRLHPLVMRYSYPSWFLPFLDLEQEATAIRSFQSQVLHGLLQAEDYARSMLRAVRPDNLNDLVAARMSRKSLFDKADRPQTWFIIDEFVLMRHIGGPEVMRAQFRALLEAGEHPRTVIQVIPRTIPAHPGVAGPFTLLSVPEGSDVLYVDGFSQGRLTPDPEEVTGAVRAYDLLRTAALSPDASAGVIEAHLKDLET